MTTVDNVEKALLGMRLLNLDSIDDVLKERVNVGMFADLRHIALWSLCNVLEKELGRLDATVLAANLDRLAPEDRATIDEDYVLDLIHWAPAAADVVVDTYVQALEDSYTKRMMEATHARVGQLLGANEPRRTSSTRFAHSGATLGRSTGAQAPRAMRFSSRSRLGWTARTASSPPRGSRSTA